MKRIITNSMIEDFKNYLRSHEKSDNTIEKYIRDVGVFTVFAEAREISKTVVMDFKASLVENYEITSANSMIAAVNAFLRFMGWVDCCIKQFKVQKKAFCSEEKELTKAEYTRLVNTAKQKGNERLNLILQTICGTVSVSANYSLLPLRRCARAKRLFHAKTKPERCLSFGSYRKSY